MISKIVLDANVWIRFARAASLSPLIDRFILYNFLPVVNSYLLSEIFDVLLKHHWASQKQAGKLIELIKYQSLYITEKAVFRLSPDPKDNYLFDLAIQQNCRFIITDDLVLLSIQIKPVPIYSSNWFLKHFPL